MLKHIKAATTKPGDPGIPIYVDPISMQMRNFDKHPPRVVIDVEGVPLKTSLRLLLKQLQLAYCVKEGMVFIGVVDQVLDELKDAEAALGVVAGPSPDLPSPPRPIVSATPKQAGAGPGPGGGRPTRKTAPGATPEVPRPDPFALKSQAIGKKLDDSITLSFPEKTPLEDVFRFIEKATRSPDGTGIPIYIDPGARSSLKNLVQIDLEGVPLRTTLTLLLSQEGLTWAIEDGLLLISTEQGLGNYGRIRAHFLTFPAFGFSDNMRPIGTGNKLLEKFNVPITLSFRDNTPSGRGLEGDPKATRGPDNAGIPMIPRSADQRPCSRR